MSKKIAPSTLLPDIQGFLGRIDHFLINRSYNFVIEPMRLFIFGSIPLLSLYLEFFAFLLL